MLEIELDQTLTPEYGAQQTMKVSPRLVAANHILELSSQALQQAIATELDEKWTARAERPPRQPSTLPPAFPGGLTCLWMQCILRHTRSRGACGEWAEPG